MSAATKAWMSPLSTSGLGVVAEGARIAFNRLKRIRMEALPSWRIADVLRWFGQKRAVRPGSESQDRALAVPGVYMDVFYDL